MIIMYQDACRTVDGILVSALVHESHILEDQLVAVPLGRHREDLRNTLTLRDRQRVVPARYIEPIAQLLGDVGKIA
jgi:hypothetical protein